MRKPYILGASERVFPEEDMLDFLHWLSRGMNLDLADLKAANYDWLEKQRFDEKRYALMEMRAAQKSNDNRNPIIDPMEGDILVTLGDDGMPEDQVVVERVTKHFVTFTSLSMSSDAGRGCSIDHCRIRLEEWRDVMDEPGDPWLVQRRG